MFPSSSDVFFKKRSLSSIQTSPVLQLNEFGIRTGLLSLGESGAHLHVILHLLYFSSEKDVLI